VTKVANERTTSVEKFALTTAWKDVINMGIMSRENVPDRNANNIFLTTSEVSETCKERTHFIQSA
jgi:hypothetical protein